MFRQVRDTAEGPDARPLERDRRGVALSPGTGEFALEPQVARYVFEGGASATANVNNSECRPDMLVALDQLAAELPACGHVSLVVSWFGDDLRAGQCRVEPRIEEANRGAEPEPWSVAGLTTASARLVGLDAAGRPVFGGTPSDGSVIRAIREMKARGLKVMLYPFLLMDVPPGNTLPDPWTGAIGQPPFPWRGRITTERAPGVAGSPDQTAAAAAEVDAFIGTVQASDFSVSDDAIAYSGPDEWTWSRFALHFAALGAAAGGVEAICIGTELRSLTQIRSDRTTYPAVERLRALAAEVRALLPEAKISYAADWSEYFGHQPQDGSGDRIFHLDPLWADANIDFVGIDDYLPLSDWRHDGPNADRDAGVPAVWSLPYLKSNVEGGELYDFFYASASDRTAQIRSPIADGAHGEPWVFRPKDIRSWWANPHHDRVGGVRSAAPTGWVPASKPVWLTETGCPAVDLGANQPNLFFDPKSSESAFPHFSTGARDDTMQRRYVQAKLEYWQEAANNPVSPVYGGAMIPAGRIYVWTWDLRPFPDFPMRESVWSDGPNYELGHWLPGRVSSGDLADVVHEIVREAGRGGGCRAPLRHRARHAAGGAGHRARRPAAADAGAWLRCARGGGDARLSQPRRGGAGRARARTSGRLRRPARPRDPRARQRRGTPRSGAALLSRRRERFPCCRVPRLACPTAIWRGPRELGAARDAAARAGRRSPIAGWPRRGGPATASSFALPPEAVWA